MNKRKKILFVFPIERSFVKRDREMLSKYFDVTPYQYNAQKSSDNIIEFIKSFLYSPLLVLKSDVIVIEFSGWHAFWPTFFAKIFKKKSAIIVCGTDAISLPEINYGYFRKAPLKWVTKYSYLFTDLVLPVSEKLFYSENNYLGYISKQGVKHFVPNYNGQKITINYGYESEHFSPRGIMRIPNSFITVASVNNSAVFQRKGIDLIIEAAKHLPDCLFTIVGVEDFSLFPTITPNVKLIGAVAHNQLVEYYSSHQFVFQISIMEGFPNALCEGMLCECVPIGSPVASIPEIIGDTGFILEKRDSKLLISLINNAINSNIEQLSKMARNRIIKNHPYLKREIELNQAIKKLISE